MDIKDYSDLYNSLADDLSKTLFLDRILYSVTKEDKYIFQLLEHSMPEMMDTVSSIDMDKELIVYGAGVNCKTALYYCKKLGKDISFICDRDAEKHGKEYQGIQIISPEELIRQHGEANILISTTRYLKEVISFLKQYFDDAQIIPLADEKVMERVKMQYFDACIGIQDGEVFVDGGSYDFETSEILLEQCRPKKIYAFEPDEVNYRMIMERKPSKDICDVEVIKKDYGMKAVYYVFGLSKIVPE